MHDYVLSQQSTRANWDSLKTLLLGTIAQRDVIFANTINPTEKKTRKKFKEMCVLLTKEQEAIMMKPSRYTSKCWVPLSAQSGTTLWMTTASLKDGFSRTELHQLTNEARAGPRQCITSVFTYSQCVIRMQLSKASTTWIRRRASAVGATLILNRVIQTEVLGPTTVTIAFTRPKKSIISQIKINEKKEMKHSLYW